MNTTQGNRYFGYIRKSTDDGKRQQLTLDAQKFEINKFAQAQGLTIIKIFEEKRSAKRPGRPIFGDVLKRISSGEANGIIAWHPDRLSRNSMDAGQILDMLDTKIMVDLKFP